jgi:predicted transcriptional regulator
MSQKESILDAIRKLPENAGFDEAIDEIRILQRIEEGEKAADEGRVRSHDEVRALIRSWIGE